MKQINASTHTTQCGRAHHRTTCELSPFSPGMGGFIVKQNWEKILYLFSLTDPNYRLSWRLFWVSQILKRCRKMLSREESMHRIQSQCIVLSTVAPSMAINQFFLADVNFTILQAFISLTSSQYMHIFEYSFLEMAKFTQLLFLR